MILSNRIVMHKYSGLAVYSSIIMYIFLKYMNKNTFKANMGLNGQKSCVIMVLQRFKCVYI